MTPQLQHIQARAKLLIQTRQFFDDQGFLEVQPPCLSRDCVVDPYIDPVSIDSSKLGVSHVPLPDQLYLQTSPESAMKRMLCAGAPSIYSIGPVFRAGERGSTHNPEFTMLEWYEIEGDATSAISLLGELAKECLLAAEYKTVTFQNAFLEAAQIDPLEDSTEKLAEHARLIDSALADRLAGDRDGLLDFIMSAQVGPTLGHDCPLILTDYPISQAALAKPSKTDARCATRFELFVSGIELANGYDELLDAQQLRARAEANNKKRIASGREQLNTETPLAQAMDGGLPQCSGVALGFDRLLMLVVGADRLDEVLPFPIEIA